MRLAFAAVLGLLATLAIVWSLGRGTPTPFLDAAGRPLAGSLSEKIHVSINGVEQGMIIKSKDVRNPVLLHLHGGMPEYFLTKRYPTGLEESFTVVWWEQRGAGLSYSGDTPPESVTPEQLIADALAVTHYLRERFGQEKIYLLGHSGGTFIGIQLAARAPELYHAYVGVAQLSHQHESERLAHAYMLQRFKDEGNARMVRRLEAAPVGDRVPLSDAYLKVRDVAMHRLGIGTTHEMTSVVTGLLLPSLLHREYTLREMIAMWRGKRASGARLWNAQLATDLATTVTHFELPVYFFHGAHDYTVSYPLAKAYFDRIDAPVKGFYTFTESAHSPLFEEPHRALGILRTVVLRRAADSAERRPFGDERAIRH